MRIKNFTANASIKSIVLLSFLLLLYLIGYIYVFVFGLWGAIFQELLNDTDLFDILMLCFVIFILPIIFIWLLISEINKRNEALRLLNQSFAIKYVDLLPGRIEFNFNDPKYNVTCGYEDIKSLEMVIHTILVHTKNGSYVAVNEVELIFSILNNKPLSLKNTPMRLIPFIYAVIDYSRNMQDFTYRFQGAGVVESVRERIQDYYQKGFKQILSKDQELIFKFLSILFYGIGICIFFTLNDLSNMSPDIVLLIISVSPILVSLVFDIILIADKVKERKHGI